jgi:hypothetical protein
MQSRHLGHRTRLSGLRTNQLTYKPLRLSDGTPEQAKPADDSFIKCSSKRTHRILQNHARNRFIHQMLLQTHTQNPPKPRAEPSNKRSWKIHAPSENQGDSKRDPHCEDVVPVKPRPLWNERPCLLDCVRNQTANRVSITGSV